ncbi:MAG: hypothetical protein U0610_08740 [bacterium]
MDVAAGDGIGLAKAERQQDREAVLDPAARAEVEECDGHEAQVVEVA